MPVRSQDGLERRRQELNSYIKELINRKDTRNSKEVINFLGLDKFSPEILYQKPKLIEKLETTSNGFYVTQCIFIARHNIFVMCLNDKSKRSSKLEIYAFKSTSLVRDSYFMKTGRLPEIDHVPFTRRYSFQGCLGARTSTFFNKEESK